VEQRTTTERAAAEGLWQRLQRLGLLWPRWSSGQCQLEQTTTPVHELLLLREPLLLLLLLLLREPLLLLLLRKPLHWQQQTCQKEQRRKIRLQEAWWMQGRAGATRLREEARALV
jgi:hypothetical protein